MARPVAALVVLLSLVALDAPRAGPFPGDCCRSARDRSGGPVSYCLADSPTSSTGCCMSGVVLP